MNTRKNQQPNQRNQSNQEQPSSPKSPVFHSYSVSIDVPKSLRGASPAPLSGEEIVDLFDLGDFAGVMTHVIRAERRYGHRADAGLCLLHSYAALSALHCADYEQACWHLLRAARLEDILGRHSDSPDPHYTHILETYQEATILYWLMTCQYTRVLDWSLDHQDALNERVQSIVATARSLAARR